MWKARSRYRQLVCAREECHECCLLRRISLVVICFFPARCIFALYVDCLESFPRHCWLFVPSLVARKRGNRTTGAKVRYRCRRCSSRLQLLAGHERFAVSCPFALIGGAFYRFLCIGSQFRSPLPPFLTLESSNGESRIIRTLVAGWCLNVMDRQDARKLSPRRRTSAQASDKDLPMRT
jgi:hypothetical protein